MRRRDKVRILREASDLIEKTSTGVYNLNVGTTYSCHAIKIVSGQMVHDYNILADEFSLKMSPIDNYCLLSTDFGLCFTRESQLHRSLLLDLYAEILENGDKV